MYDFHYGFVRKMYGDDARLLFTDTDSLAYEIRTEDFYKDIAPHVQEKFDTSIYPADPPPEFRSAQIIRSSACSNASAAARA